MNNTYIFLRHALTEINENKPIDKWVITEKGREAICEVISSGIFDDVDTIISSSEKKAIQTAYFLSERLGKEVHLNPDLKELYRGDEYLETKEEYETRVWRIFDNPTECSFGWETAEKALKRIAKAIKRFDNRYTGKKIFIVSHGIILTLFFGKLLNIEQKEYFQRWKKLKFCGWGSVSGNKVTKDIVN
ncbi:MAG: histidine phosphatase family protein [Candidatus Heimdallarchaeota archaeon]|nr:histidine phosphatase family protein [Candidatus Heimdallarchaeota archaeon]